MVVVGTDSHTTTHGAFGAFATGIGATEMAGVWVEGKLWFKVPSTLRIEVEGSFAPWVSAKDLILWIIGKLGAAALKYSGCGAVIAAGFARIFFRNAINLGLPAIVSPTASQECREEDELEVDLIAGEARNLSRNITIAAAPLDPRAIELIRAGGLIPYLKARYAARAAG